MPKYELIIAVKNESPSYRKQEGDLMAVKSYPCNWGRKEIGAGLIIIINSPRTLAQLEDMIYDMLYEYGATIINHKEYDDLVVKEQDKCKLYTKNRYSLSLIEIQKHITDLDMSKVRNKTYIYQPFKKASQLVQKFDGRNGNRSLSIGDVDSLSTVAGKEQEFVFDTSIIPVNIFDKLTNSMVKL